MASRCRTISTPALRLLRSPSSAPTSIARHKPTSLPCLRSPLSSPTLPRSVWRMASLQSLLPLHTAVSSSRLTSCLGIDSKGSRSLSQELGLSVPR
ncbi:protein NONRESPONDING TO OXYLIPINS 2, mitochondrial [Diospyros lotus]|uniref:protein NONRESPONDING TO OXYLIPINS 2, mitochondrial n=1 Tax=Diospyros lotus TaxID=55363 RepID=UPI002253A8ED|nr:protein NONRESPONDING TO OXYLIPINS 2, mitochondrial [Diospyros lotus]